MYARFLLAENAPYGTVRWMLCFRLEFVSVTLRLPGTVFLAFSKGVHLVAFHIYETFRII
jgi:hypothetical protein